MPNCVVSRVCLTTLCGLSLLWTTALVAQESKDKTSGFETPEKAFAAVRQGAKDKDGGAIYDALSERVQDAIIFSAWAEQFHFLKKKPTLAEHIDEERRLKLTREEVPTKGHELPGILSRSLKDKRAAFVALIEESNDERREKFFAGKLREVKIDGDRATGQLDDGNDKNDSTIHFTKGKRGWVVDAELKLDKKSEPAPPTKPWTGKPAPRYESPEAVFAAYEKALKENDPETLWHCCTDFNRVEMMSKGGWFMLVMTGGGDAMMSWYCDPRKARKLPRPGIESIVKDPMIETAYDRKAYFSALIKCKNQQRQSGDEAIISGPLKNLKILPDKETGVVAHGVVLATFKAKARDESKEVDIIDVTDPNPAEDKAEPRKSEPLDRDVRIETDVHFIKTESGWQIHVSKESALAQGMIDLVRFLRRVNQKLDDSKPVSTDPSPILNDQ